ncbi:MAG: toll/interleukin-1 receptor domain-containing protein [Deltaproteobacteria bacterium]|nr:toll/interleukin-1 receptor domain-containing protein [Deltaproteobacteria bacterium]MBI3077597.1 toll/interleukin-1 receptor domain-containing protein [Deltaproteobacteria bacterium]
MPAVFLSYSTPSMEPVLRLRDLLRACGLEVVLAPMPGRTTWPRIQEEVTRCQAFIAWVAAGGVYSEWVWKEVQEAMKALPPGAVIPVVEEGASAPAALREMGGLPFHPARTAEAAEESLDRLRELRATGASPALQLVWGALALLFLAMTSADQGG